MSEWSQAKFEYCTSEDFEAHRDNLKKISVKGIVKIENMGNKNFAYAVDKRLKICGKNFVAVVLVPFESEPKDCFYALEDIFKSKSDIEGMPTNEKIASFKKRMLDKYKNKMNQVSDECRGRFLETSEMRFFSLEEVREMVNGQQQEAKIVTGSIKKEVIDNVSKKKQTEKGTNNLEPSPSKEKQSISAKEVPKDASKEEEKIKKEIIEKENKFKLKEEELKEIINQKDKEIIKLAKDLKDKESSTDHKSNEEDLAKAKKEIKSKDAKIIELQKEVTEINESINKETKKAGEVMKSKNTEIEEAQEALKMKEKEVEMLAAEISDLEKTVKRLEREKRELEKQKTEWSEDLNYQEDIDRLEDELKKCKDELQEALGGKEDIREKADSAGVKLTEENAKLQEKMDKLSEELKEKTSKLDETKERLHIIEDNSKHLQSELLKQKVIMEREMKDLREAHAQKITQLEEEVKKKEAAISDLEKKVNEAPKSENQMLNQILKAVTEKEPREPRSQRSQDVSRKPSQSPFGVQVSRVRSSGEQIVMVGHPQVLRNFENTATLNRDICDLVKSENISVVTADFVGFELSSLVEDVAQLNMKPKFSEVVKEEAMGKSEDPTVIILTGSYYLGKVFMEKNAGKEPFVVKTKMKQSVDSVVNDIIEILGAVKQKNKEVVVVFDPSSEESYHYSRKLIDAFQKGVGAWKAEVEAEHIKIMVWDLTETQMKEGARHMDQRNCINVTNEDRKVIQLDRGALTADQSRISKKMTIGLFNSIVNHVAGETAAGAPCGECEVQHNPRFDRCVDGDKGEYLLCTVCLKDGHDRTTCRALKFESERFCNARSCANKKLRHNFYIHDIIDKDVRKEACKKLDMKNLFFWDKPRLKRPFFAVNSNQNSNQTRANQGGPPNKRSKPGSSE